MEARNTLLITGEITDLQTLRYTPAGLPVLEFSILHQSQQVERGKERVIKVEMPCILIGESPVRTSLLKNGVTLKARGFVASKSQRFPGSVVLHITEFELKEAR